MDLPLLLAATLGAYLAGSIPFGLLVARLTGGPDPRSIGSGRTGGTNALRALGRRRAAVVATGDILKGTLPVLAVHALAAEGAEIWTSTWTVIAALFAVIGATRSVWVGFKGGRGIATGFGTALAVAPLALAAPGVVRDVQTHLLIPAPVAAERDSGQCGAGNILEQHGLLAGVHHFGP